MKPFAKQTYYEVLDLSVTASADEIRAAYSRALETFGPDSAALYGLAGPEEVIALRARMLEAMEILTDEDLRVEYDRSIGVPPRPAAETRPPLQLVMTELMATAEATPSHPDYHISYIPHPPHLDAVQSVAQPEPSTEPAVPTAPPEPSPPVAVARLPEPHPEAAALEARVPAAVMPSVSEAVPEARAGAADVAPRLTPSRGVPFAPGSVRVAEPVAELPGEVSPSRYVESSDGVIRGPRPLDAAQEMAHESAIANAEAALAQVASRIREGRPEARAKPVEPGVDAEFNGELLRQIRESKGMTLQALAERTRIASRHLENVEADRYDALPTTVYLRGMLMSVARELGLDALRVAKSYLALVAGKTKG